MVVVKPPVISLPPLDGMPVREFLEVDLRDGDQLVVERDREVLVELCGAGAGELTARRDLSR